MKDLTGADRASSLSLPLWMSRTILGTAVAVALVAVGAGLISEAVAEEPLAGPVSDERPSFHGLKAYFGDLHQHSGYSD